MSIKDRCMTAICKRNGEVVVPRGDGLVYVHQNGTECVHGVTA